MKSIVFIFLFIPICFYSSFAQDFPTKSTVLKIISDVNRKLVADGQDELNVDTEKQFRFIDARFFNLSSSECLVIAPVLIGYSGRDLVIHFSKANPSANWTKDYLHITENVYYSGESADTIDLNPKDGVKEISYSFGTMRRGYRNETFKIVSLLNGKEKVVYSNNSFLFPGEDEFASEFSVADTVYELITFDIKDIDNDGIKEISEIKRIGLLLSKELPIGETYWNMMIEEETYSTVYSFKKGIVVKSKPKLVSTKTDDYGILTADEE